MQEALAQIKIDGTPVNAVESMPTFGEFTDLIGLPEITGLEQQYGS